MALHSQAALLLRKQLAELNKNPVEGFSAGLIDDEDIFRWEVSRLMPSFALLNELQLSKVNMGFNSGSGESKSCCFSSTLALIYDLLVFQVMIIGPPDTLYEGGFFKCHLFFPTEYPLRPPVLK